MVPSDIGAEFIFLFTIFLDTLRSTFCNSLEFSIWVKVEGIIVLGIISGYREFPKHTCSIYKDGMVSYTRTENSRKGGYSTETQLKAFPSAPAFVFIAFLLLNPKCLTEAIWEKAGLLEAHLQIQSVMA